MNENFELEKKYYQILVRNLEEQICNFKIMEKQFEALLMAAEEWLDPEMLQKIAVCQQEFAVN